MSGVQDELGASTSAQVISNKIFELSKLSPRCTTYGAMSGETELYQAQDLGRRCLMYSL